MDILYGRNPVLEALRSGRAARKLVLAEAVRIEARLQEILDLAAERSIPVETSPRRRLEDIAHSENHQGIAGYFHARPPLALPDLIASAGPAGLLLVLDGLQDPHNLGALTRTADATGMAGIVIPKHRAAPVTPAASKASAGATEHVPIASVPNLAQALDEMAAAGYLRVGLAGDGDRRFDEVDFSGAAAIVVGSEGQGMRPLTRARCDVVARIPMQGRIASLNAAIAGSILMYEAARQRGFGNP